MSAQRRQISVDGMVARYVKINQLKISIKRNVLFKATFEQIKTRFPLNNL